MIMIVKTPGSQMGSPEVAEEAGELRAATQITVWPDYFVDDRDYSSFGQF